MPRRFLHVRTTSSSFSEHSGMPYTQLLQSLSHNELVELLLELSNEFPGFTRFPSNPLAVLRFLCSGWRRDQRENFTSSPKALRQDSAYHCTVFVFFHFGVVCFVSFQTNSETVRKAFEVHGPIQEGPSRRILRKVTDAISFFRCQPSSFATRPPCVLNSLPL